MKSLLPLCLVALAKAEPEAAPKAEAEAAADPYLLYANHGVLPYHYQYQPVVYTAPQKAEDSEAEAEAEPAKAVVPLSYPYTHPLVYNTHHLVYNTHPLAYNTLPSLYNYHPLVHTALPSVASKKVEKREAEPSAEAEADPWYAYSNYYRPYSGYYRRPYAGYYCYSAYRPYAFPGYGLGK